MSERVSISTGNRWERAYTYARLNKVGDLVFIGGTLALDPDGSTHAPGDAYAQTICAYAIIERALREVGLDRSSIVRSRIYVTDITRTDDVGRAHASVFAPCEHAPCLTQVEVSALVGDGTVVEIECDAVANT